MLSAAVYTRLYATALLVIGIGSAYYHAALTFAGQTTDVAGMYLLVTFVLLYNAGRLWPIRAGVMAIGYAGINITMIAVMVAVPSLRRFLFTAVLLAAIALEIRIRMAGGDRSNVRLFVAALASLALGFAFWLLDISHIVCSPASLVQGHAVWHLCGAIAGLLVYLYYLSEGAGVSDHPVVTSRNAGE